MPLTRSNDSGVTHIDRIDDGVALLPGLTPPVLDGR